MNTFRHLSLLAALTGVVLLPLSSSGPEVPEQPSAPRMLEVTVTNLTAGQVFTPLVVASHRKGFRFFETGTSASIPLETLAEGGATGPLAMALSGSADVMDVVEAGMPLPPGQSMTLTVNAQGTFQHVSLAGMLVPTNDAFVALADVPAPLKPGTSTFYARAYDAGTEANDESCTHIPGPPMTCMGEGFNTDRTGAEGFVHVHRGIHGGGDLDASLRDWRNPVARVEIRRVP